MMMMKWWDEMFVSKLHSGTSKTKVGKGGLVWVALFWKSHCATCSPACVILYHVTGSCKGPIILDQCTWTFSSPQSHFFIKLSCWNVEVETILERRDPWPDLTIMLVSDDRKSLHVSNKKYLTRVSKNNKWDYKLSYKAYVKDKLPYYSSSFLCKLHCTGE